MIGYLRGIVRRGAPGEVIVDVQGVGYRLHTPLSSWEALEDGVLQPVWVTTYVREDRLELFGFADESVRRLFERLIQISGIGPKTALDICAAPRSLLAQAVAEDDPTVLTSIKGIGKKTAEKFLVELKSLAERDPGMLVAGDSSSTTRAPAGVDRDAVAALTQLGYRMPDALKMLESLPSSLTTTEQRVAAALRSA